MFLRYCPCFCKGQQGGITNTQLPALSAPICKADIPGATTSAADLKDETFAKLVAVINFLLSIRAAQSRKTCRPH